MVADLAGVEGDPSVLEAASSALIALRRVKSEAKVSPRTPFLAVTVAAPQAQVDALESVKGDLEAASKAVGALTVAASDALRPPRPWSSPSSWARLLPSARRGEPLEHWLRSLAGVCPGPLGPGHGLVSEP